MNICCNRLFSCQFWHGASDITQIIKNWKHWLRIHNLPVDQSFEKATKACVLGYIASSCAALSNFTMMCSKNLLPGATQNEYLKNNCYRKPIIHTDKKHWIQTHARKRTHARTCTHAHASACTHTQTHTHTYACVHTHTCMRACTHMHTHTCTCTHIKTKHTSHITNLYRLVIVRSMLCWLKSSSCPCSFLTIVIPK